MQLSRIQVIVQHYQGLWYQQKYQLLAKTTFAFAYEFHVIIGSDNKYMQKKK